MPYSALLRRVSAGALTLAWLSSIRFRARSIADDRSRQRAHPTEINTANEDVGQPAGVSAVVDDLLSKSATTSDTASLLRDVPGAFVYNAGGVSGLPVLDGRGRSSAC